MSQGRPCPLYTKLFIRFRLDYGDILHDKLENENFQNKLINQKKFNIKHALL